jgi:hypothetical protein
LCMLFDFEIQKPRCTTMMAMLPTREVTESGTLRLVVDVTAS